MSDLTNQLQKFDARQAKQRTDFIAEHIKLEAKKLFDEQRESHKIVETKLASLKDSIKLEEARLNAATKQLDSLSCMYVICEDDFQGGGPYQYTYILASSLEQARAYAREHCHHYTVERINFIDVR